MDAVVTLDPILTRVTELEKQNAELTSHLANVLYMLADLHPDEHCAAFVKARAYYNAANPNNRVEPHKGWVTELVHTGPLDVPTAIASQE